MILILTPDINFEFKYEFLILEFRYGLLIQFKYALLIKSGLLIQLKDKLHGTIEIWTPDMI